MSGERVAGRLRPIVQVSGFVRKEITEIVRQPRLVLLMVIGPFLVLALFALGFDQQQAVLQTKFVGPEGSVYEDAIEEFSDDLQQYVDNAGYTSDLISAEQELRNGDIDIIVIFPADPTETILGGDQASITVLHNKIDPIQQVTVEVSTEVAVQELNARILERVIGGAQSALVPYESSLDTSLELLDQLGTAVTNGDDDEVARLVSELDDTTGALSTIVDVTDSVTSELDSGDDGDLARLSTSAAALDDAISSLSDDVSDDDVEALRTLLEEVEVNGETVTTLDPRIVVRPFAGETANLQRESVGVEDFFAPGAVALLLQHMVLTFAAMSLVRDRTLGLFETFRVGPIGAGRILVSKFIAFSVIGLVAATALIAAIRYGLDVPLRGNVLWVAVGVMGVLLSSTALGTLISLISKSDTQAVQYALLALLAGLFFGGFFLDLDSFTYPVKAVAWTLPVTYGVRILRDVMLRGVDPATGDLAGLAAATTVYLALASVLLVRRMRVR